MIKQYKKKRIRMGKNLTGERNAPRPRTNSKKPQHSEGHAPPDGSSIHPGAGR